MADLIAKFVVEDVTPLAVCCNTLYWLMLLPSGHILFYYFVMADVTAQWQMEKPHTFLLFVVMADVIAQWQMEWPL